MVFFSLIGFFLISNSQFNFELSCNLDLLTLVFFLCVWVFKKKNVGIAMYREIYPVFQLNFHHTFKL